MASPAPRGPVPALAADLSRRISMLRFLLIVGIVMVHVPQVDDQVSSALPGFLALRAFLTDGLARAALPTLSAISGFLLFRSGLDREPLRLLRNKTSSLVTPHLMWNLGFLVVLGGLQAAGIWTPGFVRAWPLDARTWFEGSLALHGVPAIPPLYFLRDLFVVSLCAPLLGVLLRGLPFLGAVLVALVFGADLDARTVLRDDIPIAFYLGGLIAVRGWDPRSLDRHAPWLLLLLLAGSAWSASREELPLLFRIVAPILVWPLSAGMLRSPLAEPIERWAAASFLVFLLHWILLHAFWRAFQLFDPTTRSTLEPAYWLVAPLLAVLTIHALHAVLERRAPRLLRAIQGGRPSPRSSPRRARPVRPAGP